MNRNETKIAERIRAEYTPSEKSARIDELRELDRRVHRPADIFAYIFGTVGSLVLGTGMCLAMEVIGQSMALGIGIGLVGIAMVAVNYSLHRAILGRRRAKYAERIVELTDSILDGESN